MLCIGKVYIEDMQSKISIYIWRSMKLKWLHKFSQKYNLNQLFYRDFSFLSHWHIPTSHFHHCEKQHLFWNFKFLDKTPIFKSKYNVCLYRNPNIIKKKMFRTKEASHNCFTIGKCFLCISVNKKFYSKTFTAMDKGLFGSKYVWYISLHSKWS